MRIQLDLRDGQRTLDDVDMPAVSRAGGIEPLAREASAAFDRAADRAASSPFLRVLSPLPVIGSQVDAVRDLTAAAATVGKMGHDAAKRVDDGLDATKGDPTKRVELLDTVVDAINEMHAGIDRIEVGADGWLLPPLAAARENVVKDLEKAGPKLDDLVGHAESLRRFLVGPSKYLVLGGNNAEMRAFGIATTSGLSIIENGKISVGDFRDVDYVNLPYPGIPIPAEFENLYGWLLPGQGYESTVMSPNFPAAAAISSDISDHNVIGPIDGVVYTDTWALQSLLFVIGPVTVDGVTYDKDNASRLLINENYLRYRTLKDSPERRKSQSEVAKAIFDALNTRDYEITLLAKVLSDLAKGRHLALWAKDPDVQKVWTEVDADGRTHPEDLQVVSQDLGASKLDFYVRLTVDVTVERVRDGRRLSMDITVDNPKKTGPTSPYILGGSIYADKGDYGSYLQLSFPKEAFDLEHPNPVARSGTDGPLQVMAIAFRVPPGRPVTQHFEMTLPADFDELQILPSARLNPITYRFNGQETDDYQPTKVDLALLTRSDPQLWYLIVGLVAYAVAAGFAAAGALDRRQASTAPLGALAMRAGSLLAIAGTALLVAQIVANLVYGPGQPFSK